MSLEELYENPNVSRMEEKFSVIKKLDTEYEGKYPLELFREGARGVYGGEFAAQSLLAAYDYVDDPEFSPHSFHSHFLKAGLNQLKMRFEVEKTSQGRNYCSRLVKTYQLHTNQLCYIMTVSFVRKNLIDQRKKEFAQLGDDQKYHPRTKIPIEFTSSPHPWFDKYVKKLDSLPSFEHTNGNLLTVLPPEVMRENPLKKELSLEIPYRHYGGFFKVNDDLSKAKNPDKQRHIDLTFGSDSYFLMTMVRALGIPLMSKGALDFFRVSLDHTVYFHDSDFDPTDFMFMDYNFERLANDRVLCSVKIYSRQRKHVATVIQEALTFVPLALADRARGATYKL